MRLLVVAGEASGDLIAAEVLDSLAVRCAALDAFGIVGPAARARGARALVRTEDLSAMGLAEVLPRAPRIARAVRALLAAVRSRRPTAALLVDYHELNLLLGRFLRRAGIPVLLVVAPQTWAWRAGRTRTLTRSVDHVAAILPFEPAHLARAGVPCSYVGHPAYGRARPSRDEARRTLGLDPAARVLAVLPGSRHGEVSRLAPVMSDAARALRARGLLDEILCPRASTVDPAWLAAIERDGARIVSAADASATVLAASDTAVVCSGTATLECALARTPMIVVYRLAPSSAVIARAALRVRSVAMPNLLLARPVVPELLQSRLNAAAIVELATTLLDSRSQARRDQLDALRRVGERLRPPGPDGTRAADHVAAILANLEHR
ncbi:MAG: lipid-A-disaccharide synthase [Deltaproteobacteria bacterium]|nr:lipid-A-disaccharide synthase [Deltaproteobacteria bacterium]